MGINVHFVPGNNMQIILISGKAQVGKDSTALILKDKFEKQNKKVLITHFADLLKFICKKYFNWSGLKNYQGRTLLQYVGTDIVRNIKPNYWVDFIIEVLSIFKDHWDYVLIPDCRFKSECTRWGEDWDTTTVRVERLNFESPLTPEQQLHPSETALDDYNFDYTIRSENGLDNLEKEVGKFLVWLQEEGN